jgi:ABC transport system ATP-binding/permease protein
LHCAYIFPARSWQTESQWPGACGTSRLGSNIPAQDPSTSAGAGGTVSESYAVQLNGDETRLFEVTEKGLLVGRQVPGANPPPDVPLRQEGTASRRHARVFIEDGQCWVEDLGSTNGTFVDSRPIVGRHRVSNGDRIKVGDEELLVVGGPAEVSEDKPVLRGLETVFDPAGSGSDGLTRLQQLVGPAEIDVMAPPPPAAYTGAKLRIGRDPDNDVVLDNPNVSRFHAVIEPGGDGVQLRDLASRNGTRLNGSPVSQAALKPGAEIGIGPFRLTFTGSEVRARSEQGSVSVEAVGVSVTAQGRQILAPTYLTIRPGELVGIIGENGAGKTTLLRALAGAAPVTGGQVLINGESVAHRLTDIGYVPQDDTVHRWLKVGEALRFGARLRLPEHSRDEVDQAVDTVIAQLGLDEQPGPTEPQLRDRFIGSDDLPTPGKLSGGQRKRTCVAMEMLARPSVVFLDEPTSPLDPLYSEELIKLLQGLARSACSVVLVTHKTDDVALCDKVAVMARGGFLAFYGTPLEALRFFGVNAFKDIYSVLQTRTGPEWGEHAGGEVPAARARDSVERPQPAPQPVQPTSTFAQTRILARRYALLLLRDRSNLLGMTLSVPVIAVFLLAFHRNIMRTSRAPTFLFVLVFVVILLGVIASFRELVKERPIFRRERDVGVSVLAYVSSKLVVLGFVGAAQSVVLAALAFATHPLNRGAGSYAASVGVLVLASFAGITMGLAISAVVKSQEQATTLISIPLVLQLLFAGSIVPLSSVKVPAALMPARWAYGALGRLANLNGHLRPSPDNLAAFGGSVARDVGVLVLFPVLLSAFVLWWLAKRVR